MFFLSNLFVILTSLSITYGYPSSETAGQSLAGPLWTKESFKNAVYFGDSYTDTGRGIKGLSGKIPPGWEEDENGLFSRLQVGWWPTYVKRYSGASKHNYAINGATCTKKVLGGGVATVLEQEVPNFEGDLAYKLPNGTKFLDLTPENTVYGIWIGTNDLGAMGLLARDDGASKIPAYTECVYEVFDRIYAAGGRKFILMNVIPLNLTPMYTLEKGEGADTFWPNKPATKEGLDAAKAKLKDLVDTSNAAFMAKSRDVFKGPKPRYPGAGIALYDVHKMFTDIYNNPKDYFNGTEPPNVVTGMQALGLGLGSGSTSPDSYMWGDSLHPSEATGRWTAKEFINVASGTSKYATYFSDTSV